MCNMESDLLKFPDQVDEQSLVSVAQIGQIVREISEIVTDSDFDVIADVAVECHKESGAILLSVGQVEPPPLYQSIPAVNEVPICT